MCASPEPMLCRPPNPGAWQPATDFARPANMASRRAERGLRGPERGLYAAPESRSPISAMVWHISNDCQTDKSHQLDECSTRLPQSRRHSRGGGNPDQLAKYARIVDWIPASAGMTVVTFAAVNESADWDHTWVRRVAESNWQVRTSMAAFRKRPLDLPICCALTPPVSQDVRRQGSRI